MSRHLLNLLTVPSLLLFIAASVLWARSYWVSDTVTWEGVGAKNGRATRVESELSSGRGGIMWQRVTTVVPPATRARGASGARGVGWQATTPAWTVGGGSGGFWGRRGFNYSKTGPLTAFGRVEHEYGALPIWFVSMLTAAAAAPGPTAWTLRRRRRRRAARGACRSCGYDLNGNVSGVCPECGRASASA